MLNDYQSIDALVAGVKGTTGLLSRLISRKFGFMVLISGVAVIISKFLLG